MINSATSFWAGFATHPRPVLLPILPTPIYSPGLTPQTHTWAHVPLEKERHSRRFSFCMKPDTRTFVTETLQEPRPGSCISFHSISAEEEWPSNSVTESMQRGNKSSWSSSIEGWADESRSRKGYIYKRSGGSPQACESEICCVVGWFIQPPTGKRKCMPITQSEIYCNTMQS